MTLQNMNQSTGIRFGSIYGSAIEPEVLYKLQDAAENKVYEQHLAAFSASLASKTKDLADSDSDDLNLTSLVHLFKEEVTSLIEDIDQSGKEFIRQESENIFNPDNESSLQEVLNDFQEFFREQNFEFYEASADIEFEGVSLNFGYLGGAILLIIIKSDKISHCDLCSPCVPNAGNLESLCENGYLTYDVPDSWRRKED